MVKLTGTVALFIGLIGLSACGLLPTSSGYVQASRSQQCAKISWQDLGLKSDAGLTRLAYGPNSGPGVGPQPPSSAELAEFDQPLRSAQSIGLSDEIRRENEKAYLQGVEHWLQSHLTVQVRSCPS